MKNRIKQRMNQSAGIILFIGILLFALASCKSPNGVDSNIKAKITITNSCGASVEIYFDGRFSFVIANGLSQVIENIAQGAHLLDAWKEGTDMLVASEGFNISSSGDYTWQIEGPSRIIVTNKYGETLKIQIDGSYLGDLDNTYSEGITKITFGLHTLDAIKNNTVVATITIDVTEVKDYYWEIEK
jgi:hypothetical protein